jgi:hypothetical protein
MQPEQIASYGFINKFTGVGEKMSHLLTGKMVLFTENALLLTSLSLTPQALQYRFV